MIPLPSNKMKQNIFILKVNYLMQQEGIKEHCELLNFTRVGTVEKQKLL